VSLVAPGINVPPKTPLAGCPPATQCTRVRPFASECGAWAGWQAAPAAVTSVLWVLVPCCLGHQPAVGACCAARGLAAGSPSSRQAGWSGLDPLHPDATTAAATACMQCSPGQTLALQHVRQGAWLPPSATQRWCDHIRQRAWGSWAAHCEHDMAPATAVCLCWQLPPTRIPQGTPWQHHLVCAGRTTQQLGGVLQLLSQLQGGLGWRPAPGGMCQGMRRRRRHHGHTVEPRHECVGQLWRCRR
jgi:hypothetical protein